MVRQGSMAAGSRAWQLGLWKGIRLRYWFLSLLCDPKETTSPSDTQLPHQYHEAGPTHLPDGYEFAVSSTHSAQCPPHTVVLNACFS